MEFNIREENGFRYIDEGEGEVMLLLHGLFGALSNWAGVLEKFSQNYRVMIPMLPIYDMPLKSTGVEGLTQYVERFVEEKQLNDIVLLGNSLGGHVALVYTLRHADKIKKLVLTGSSGLYESGMGNSYPKRGNYEFIKEKVAYTFYDPNVATKELVDEVYEVTNSNAKCLRIVYMARSAQKHNMRDEVTNITAPTLLIWGLNDTITPPQVGHEFNTLIPNSELKFIDKCCHAPMMEHPETFNDILDSFLERNRN